MKFFNILLLFVLFGYGLNVQAQFNQFGRPAQRGERGYVPPPRPVAVKEIEKPEIDEYTEDRATLYSEEFGFDAFQKEVLKRYLKKYYVQKLDVEYNPDLKYEDKLSLIQGQQKVFKKDLSSFLTDSQVLSILEREQYGKRTKDKKNKKNKGKKNKKGKKS